MIKVRTGRGKVAHLVDNIDAPGALCGVRPGMWFGQRQWANTDDKSWTDLSEMDRIDRSILDGWEVCGKCADRDPDSARGTLLTADRDRVLVQPDGGTDRVWISKYDLLIPGIPTGPYGAVTGTPCVYRAS